MACQDPTDLVWSKRTFLFRALTKIIHPEASKGGSLNLHATVPQIGLESESPIKKRQRGNWNGFVKIGSSNELFRTTVRTLRVNY